MYPWIWRHLPGPLPAKAITAALLALVVIAALWVWAFPWADTHLPLDTVDFAG
jgi:hypothetical protein